MKQIENDKNAQKQIFDYKQNGIDFIRYYAAICVMILHYSGFYMMFSETSNNRVADFFRNWSLITPGLVILFSISGFFAMASLERSDAKLFLKNKVLRIYPELWLCTIINIITIITIIPSKITSSIFPWIIAQFFGLAYTPDFFKEIATKSINGTLWTILVQVQFYVIITLIYRLVHNASKRIWITIITISVMLNLISFYISSFDSHIFSLLSKALERSFIPYFIWFIIGAFIFEYKESLLPIISKFWWVGAIIITLVFFTPIFKFGYYTNVLTGLILPFTIIGVSYALPKIRLFDISYSMFLYHWIIINVFIILDVFNKINGLLCLVLFFVLTILLSIFSTFFTKWIKEKLFLKK